MTNTPQDAISDVEFAETFKESQATVNRLVTESHPDSLLPVLQVIAREDFGAELAIHAFGLADLPGDHEDRAKIFQGLGQMVYANRDKFGAPVAITFCCEAWTLGKLSPEAIEMFKQSGKSVSEHKNKQECVIVTSRTIDGRKGMAMYETVRKDGNLDHLKKTVDSFENKPKSKQVGIETNLLDNFYRGMYNASRKES